MTRPIYVNKNLAAASSNVLGSISSATGAITLNTSGQPLDTPRRISIQSSVNISSGVTFTITGTVEGGGTKTETFYSSTGAAITSVDFLTVTSVSMSSVPAAGIPMTIGTNTTGGTRWIIADQILGGAIMGAITFSSSNNGMTATAEWTLDDPTNIYPITRLGQPFPQPTVWNSSMLNGVSTAANGIVNIDGQVITPAFAYRLTITSSSSGAGTVYATFLQQG